MHVSSTCMPAGRRQKELEEEVAAELPWYELERLYSGTPAGRSLLSDIRATQKGKPHPDPQVRPHALDPCSLIALPWPVQKQRELQAVQGLQGAGVQEYGA